MVTFRIGIGIAFCLTLLSCKLNEKQKARIYKIENSILVDSVQPTDIFLDRKRQIVDYPIYYVGLSIDTLKIGLRYAKEYLVLQSKNHEPSTKTYSSLTLNLFVDTTFVTNSPIEYSSHGKYLLDSFENYNSYVLRLKNISDSTIFIGRTNALFFVFREVKNKEGKWVKIENSLSEQEMCTTTEPYVYLKPNEILISKVKRFKGNIKSAFRVVFQFGEQIIYSNIYQDNIDKKTFNSL